MNTHNTSMLLQLIVGRVNSPAVKQSGKRTRGISVTRLSAFLVVLMIAGSVFTAISHSRPSALLRSTQSTLLQPGGEKNRSELASTGNLLARPLKRNVDLSRSALSSIFLTQAPQSELIITYASDCTTAQSDFDFGETVCAVVTDAPSGGGRQRLAWAHTDGFLAREVEITSSTQSDSLLLTPTAQYGGDTRNNAGTWRITTIDADGAPSAVAYFTIHDPDNPTSDLSVYKFPKQGETQVNEGIDISFVINVSNQGPDNAHNVTLFDGIPDAATFVSLTQDAGSGPEFSCDGTVCVIENLARGERANFTAVYHTNGVVSNTPTTYSATVSSDPDELRPADNTASGEITVVVTSTTGTCTLDCPDHINATANTTEGGLRGAHVVFDGAAPTGDCGAVTATPASGSFFPVGTTTVSVSSETNGGTCSFTITVEDVGTDPPTISCPASQEVTANSNCEASVTLGNPSTSGSNVTVIGTRSDGKPMYNCDVNGNNCTRRVPDDPFPAGITTVTWTAYSHDIPGPFPISDDEEAHRTGSASCTQTVTVNDVVPPTITATPQTVSADASCQAAVPDFTETASVSDNCACASSDESENCVNREPITISQSPAPGTMVGLGPHTITLTANDGSSNNDGDGNTATTTTTFTVNDTTAPTVTAPADSSASADASCQAPVPNYAAGASASDNCDSSLTVTQSPAAGSLVGVGPHTVTVTATDDAGNSTSDDVVFTVNDTTAPTVTAPADSSASADASCQAPVPNYAAASIASDNCGNPTVTQSPAAGTMVGKGPHTVTVTATDGAGNNSSDQVVFTVNDTTPPTISCQADIIADYDAAVNGAVVTYTAPVGTDNCAGATTTQIAGLASGSTFPVGTTTNTFTVTDGVGLTATCSFKVTVALTSLIGLDSVTMTGAGYADSYSSAGGYPATKGSLANILSNGTITMGNSAKVWGNVRSTRANVNMTGASQVTGNATAGTNVTTSGSATVGGVRTNNALAPVMTLPSVPACSPFSSASGITGTYSYNASTGNLTLSGVNIATLANGDYCFNNVTIGNSAQLKVNGPVVIKLKGTLNTSGASSLNNTTQIPSNLRILSSYSGSNGVVIGNSVSVYALIYAPKTNVNMSGAAPLFGTAAGKTITIGNSGAIHYDTQLKTIWPALWALIVGP